MIPASYNFFIFFDISQAQEVLCLHQLSQTNNNSIAMGKRSRNDGANGVEKINGKESVGKSFLTENKAVDPTLALLFASSVSL